MPRKSKWRLSLVLGGLLCAAAVGDAVASGPKSDVLRMHMTIRDVTVRQSHSRVLFNTQVLIEGSIKAWADYESMSDG